MTPSFFEKLKRGMGIEMPAEKKVAEEPKREEKVMRKKPKKVEKVAEEVITEKPMEKAEKVEIKKPEKWPQAEGQLAIDLYETEGNFVIQSTIAGVKAGDLDISIEGDRVTIKGNRPRPIEEERNYIYQECYWGPFSREIILPEEVDGEKAEAKMKDGILTLKIPKAVKIKKRKILVKEEG